MEMTCPKSEKCPIFQGGVLKRANSERVYRSLYCNAGSEKYTKCMRYIVAEKAGKPAPISVLPNCSKSVDEILKEL
jgi:hypothetical protein